MSNTKPYSDNFISERSSTKLHHPPGGSSQMGSFLFGGGEENNANVGNKQIKQNTVDKNNKPESKMDNNEESKCVKDTQHITDAEKVREFTREAGQNCPNKPQLMDLDEVNFISKMILDELLELYSTVLPPQAAKNAMKKMLDEAKCITKMNVSPNQTHELIAEQGDALVDIYYYSLNCMAKKGVNLSKIFNLVHGANMAKRDPITKKFIKREDGKIIKPKGWCAPDVKAEIQRQSQNGSWQ
eukprot:295598_1